MNDETTKQQLQSAAIAWADAQPAGPHVVTLIMDGRGLDELVIYWNERAMRAEGEVDRLRSLLTDAVDLARRVDCGDPDCTVVLCRVARAWLADTVQGDPT